MNKEEADIDLIERKLRGELTQAEQDAFDARVASELAFAEKVDDYLAIMSGIRNFDSHAMREEVAQWEREIRNEEQAETPVVPLGSPWKKYLVAASVAASIVAAYLFFDRVPQNSNQDLVAAYFVPYGDVISVREGENDSELLMAAMESYSAGKWAEAISLFHASLEKNPDNPDAAFYLGIAYLANQDPVQAANVLERLRNGDHPYNDHVMWYLALAKIASDDIVEAKEILREIQSQPSHDFSRQAGQLMRELK